MADELEDQESRATKVIDFICRASQNSSRLSAQGVDMLLKISDEDVVNATKAKENLRSIRSKIEYFQKHERILRGYTTLLNDLPGAELNGEEENLSKEYVDEFLSAIPFDEPTDAHKRQVERINKLIQVVIKTQPVDGIECGISGKQMNEPFRNTNCEHVYDQKSINSYLDRCQQGHQPAKCPVKGCGNDQPITWETLVPDPTVRRAIDEAYFHEVMNDNGEGAEDD